MVQYLKFRGVAGVAVVAGEPVPGHGIRGVAAVVEKLREQPCGFFETRLGALAGRGHGSSDITPGSGCRSQRVERFLLLEPVGNRVDPLLLVRVVIDTTARRREFGAQFLACALRHVSKAFGHVV